MAKVYVSYASEDKSHAQILTKKLRERGVEVIFHDEITPGTEWRRNMANALKEADGIVAIISENILSSQFVLTEIGQARAFIDSKFLIPIIFGDIEIPAVIKDIQCLFAKKYGWDELAEKIISAIDIYQKKKTLENAEIQKKNAERIEKIQRNAPEYVDKTIKELKSRETRNRILGNIWNTVGFICLLAGVILGSLGIQEYLKQSEIGWISFAILTLKTAVVVGLLIACSKYSFTLGKTYTNEALKNADRAHAISFGNFYLNAYGDTVNWSELKEAFQHWNVSGDNSFRKLDANQFDPKFAEMVIEVAKAVTNKSENK